MNRDQMVIEVDKLLEKLDDPNLRLYDATILFFRQESDLTAHETYLQEHIPGAAFFDHKQFSVPDAKYMYTVLPEEELKAQIGRAGIAPGSEVVFYTTGYFPCATRAWWLLRYAGHNNVRVLNGGLAAWKNAGGLTARGGSEYAPAAFNGSARPEMFASKEEVLAAMKDGAVCTVNTLTMDVYQKGHIVGSSCLPCTDLMADMASFLPEETIAARLRTEAQHERIITYCGGGIAATVNAMAHLMAGNPNVSVYDGSMSEWVGEGLPTAGENHPRVER